MFCPNCGKQLRDGSKFCGFCGKDLSDRKEPAPAPKSEETSITIKIPKVDIPKVDMSTIKMPKVEMPKDVKVDNKTVKILIGAAVALLILVITISSMPKTVVSCKVTQIREPVTCSNSVTAKGTGKKLTQLVWKSHYTTSSSLYADSTYSDVQNMIDGYFDRFPDAADIVEAKVDRGSKGGTYYIDMTATFNLKKIKSIETAKDLYSFGTTAFGELFDYVYYENNGSSKGTSSKEYLKTKLRGQGFNCDK